MLDIPGYRILRALGRGGMATVYLAMQESVQREVALKVMSPTLHGDAEFGERFLREARIAASLRHRHVVQVHDVGRADDLHYIAMEYLSGGQVLNRTNGAGDLAFCLRVTREIALALDYAHRRGVIHRDIKPDNILLRDDGAAVLSDFGIARAHDSKRMTMTGTILGTPHYMAPEQASGSAVDGRADLYALGVVFHEMAVGVVPFDAADWVSVGLMHLSAPVPRLPPALSRLQPLIDTMLAKDPSERLQTGAEVAEVIAEMELSMAAPRSPAISAAPAKAELAERGINSSAQASTRRRGDETIGRAAETSSDEPSLGEIAEALSSPSQRTRRRAEKDSPRQSALRPWHWALGLLALLLIGAYSQRDVLRDRLLPSRNEALLTQADEALRERRLVGQEPPGARELFQAVLALDPDNARARAGLAQVAENLLSEARAAIAHDRMDEARQWLGRARDAEAPAREIEQIEADIRNRAQHDDRLADLVGRAQTALAAGRLDAANEGALALYAQALAVDPSSSVALAGRREALSLLLDRARQHTDEGKFAEAQAQIDAVTVVDAAHLGLPEALTQLAQARQQAGEATNALIAEGDALRKRGRLISPAGDNARERYRSALAREPNVQADDGLRAIAAALVQQASKRMADYEFEPAAALLDEAAATQASAPGLSAARTRLRELQQRRGDLASGTLSADQQAALQQALTGAALARKAGNLLYPPGESAWDLYRRALTLDRDNTIAKQGLAELPAATRQLFEDALGSNKVGSARGYLEGLQTLAPNDIALPDMKRRLAASLVGYATERLGANEISRASDALLQAAELDPNNTNIASLRARIDQAREK